MKCPECGSLEYARPKSGPHAWRKAVDKWGATYRVHQCLECGHVFLSRQIPLHPDDARMILAQMEEDTLTRLLRSSKPKRGDEASDSASISETPAS